MKKIIIALLPLALASCASLTPEGQKVHLELVQRDTVSVSQAKKKLETQNCTYVKKIKANIAANNGDTYWGLEVGLKNKTAEVGGNAVISSLTPETGFPIYTKGIVYRCPTSLVADDV